MNIDKNIPVPTIGNKFAELAKKMEVGDSVLVTTQRQVKSLCQSIRNAGFAQTTRKEDGGWRVWKLARPS